MENSIQPQTPKGFPRNLIIGGVLVIAVLALVGYSIQTFVLGKLGKFAVQKAIESQTGAKVDYNDNGSLKINSKEGNLEIGTAAKWPEGMPSDIPQFSFGTITASMKTDNENGKGWTVMAKDVEKNSFDKYIKDLEGKGWITKSTISMAVDIYQMEKGNLSLNLSYDPSSKGMNLTLEEKSK